MDYSEPRILQVLGEFEEVMDEGLVERIEAKIIETIAVEDVVEFGRAK